jgi:hypothetical protein
MAISRRKFAQKAGLAIVGAGLAGSAAGAFSRSPKPGSLFGISARPLADPLTTLRSDLFLPYIGTIFHTGRIHGPGNSLQLTDVILHRRSMEKSSETGGESFSLLFRSIGRKRSPGEIHIFRHPSLGTFSLFIAPVERAKKTYEAVINHLPS